MSQQEIVLVNLKIKTSKQPVRLRISTDPLLERVFVQTSNLNSGIAAEVTLEHPLPSEILHETLGLLGGHIWVLQPTDDRRQLINISFRHPKKALLYLSGDWPGMNKAWSDSNAALMHNSDNVFSKNALNRVAYHHERIHQASERFLREAMSQYAPVRESYADNELFGAF